MFVNDLEKWKCANNTIQECLIDCIKFMIEKRHLDINELEFYKAWIEDLEKLGHQWPKFSPKKRKIIRIT